MSEKVDTQTLPERDPDLTLAMAERSKRLPGTATLTTKTEVMLIIEDEDVKRFSLDKETRLLLGRFESTDHADQIDLIPYGAREKGVSRFHLQLKVENDQLFAIDLNSTNGTYIGDEPLPPNQKIIVRNGDVLLLGRLSIRVLFR
jgi:pSer/pThr/pTyr-binding forkhead associated (FHA) protein